MEPAPLPKVDNGCVRWWHSRLEQYRNLVVFTWNALTFHQSNLLPGAAVWFGINITCIVLLRMSYSTIQMFGEALLILGLVYLLLQVALKAFEFELFPKIWTAELEGRFHHICVHTAHGEHIVTHLLAVSMELRKTRPWKFYCVVLVVSLLLAEAGRWLSTALFLQLLICLIMMLPPVLEYGLLSPENQKNFKLIATEIYITLSRKLKELSARNQR